jgi:hypothetical protein
VNSEALKVGVAIPTISDITTKVSVAAFGRPLITNILRGQVAEAIVAAALEPQWHWCSGDWASWDFEREAVRLEVKQSALVQTWGDKPTKSPRFDIRERHEWCGETNTWLPDKKRFAHIYLFALHSDVTCPDHRDARQWTFYVIPTDRLPESQNHIALGSVKALADQCSYVELRSAVNSAYEALRLGGIAGA